MGQCVKINKKAALQCYVGSDIFVFVVYFIIQLR